MSIMRGVVDIGSNTIRLSVFEMQEQGKLKTVFNKKETTGLANYIDEDGVLSKEGIDAAIGVLQDYKVIGESIGLEKLHAFATASVRNVINTKEIVEAIYHATGIRVDVLSGEEEAECDYIGASMRVPLESGILVDIGGGSTEITIFEKKQIKEALSFPVGSLNMYKEHVTKVFPTKDELEEIEKHMVRYLARIEPPEMENVVICGVGGSIRGGLKLYNALNDTKKNVVMQGEDFRKLLKRYHKEPKKVMAEIVQLLPDRTHTLLPGLALLNAVVQYFEAKAIYVSSYGVREGYFIKKVMD
jgi:exopolyphosphatase/guanosine-5'-triphosphate,3'-diphosphate pyrophosphatase